MEPQITAIASYVATRIPTDGVEPEETVEAWRATLRYARKSGAIEPLTELMQRAEPDDEQLLRHCEDLRK